MDNLLGKTVRIKNLYDSRGERAKAVIEAVWVEYPTLETRYDCWVYFAEVIVLCSLEQIEVSDEPSQAN